MPVQRFRRARFVLNFNGNGLTLFEPKQRAGKLIVVDDGRNDVISTNFNGGCAYSQRVIRRSWPEGEASAALEDEKESGSAVNRGLASATPETIARCQKLAARARER